MAQNPEAELISRIWYYVVTPEMYRDALVKIEAAADEAGREFESYGTSHLLFARIGDNYEEALDAATETLSVRYNMDFRKPAMRYAAIGRPEDVAAKIDEFRQAGLRHCVLDLVGPYEERDQQIERFAKEVRTLIAA